MNRIEIHTLPFPSTDLNLAIKTCVEACPLVIAKADDTFG